MRAFFTALILTALSGSACAQLDALSNAEVMDSAFIDDPSDAVHQVEDGWFAFSIPAIEGTRSPCCWKGIRKRDSEIGCKLGRDFDSYGTMSTSPIEENLIAYVKVTGGEARKLMIAGEQCPMDADGQAVTWIGETRDHDTLDWLEEAARHGSDDELAQSALWALAVHASDGAGDRLQTLAREPGGKRAEESIFWLGQARGEAGYEALNSLLDTLPRGDTRRHINFALSQSASDRAARLLTDIARDDHDPEQRADALFWLAQEHPTVAEETILDVIENERDDELLERVVFALSRLPPDVSGPALLALVRDSDAPREVRRQAMFWLAHEGDEASVAELTGMLLR